MPWWCWPLLLAGLVLPAPAAEPVDPAARVVVLASAGDPESVALARYYVAQRGIPPENIVALPMPATESITWREFVDQIHQPLQDELIRRGWIDALPSSLLDALGRKRYSMHGHRISYLVVCRGVPLRIYHDPTVVESKQLRQVGKQFQTNQGAVDSELSLLAQSGYGTLAQVPNPLYAKEAPSSFDEETVVRVSRLDGPTPEDARRLVQSALEGERQGLLGRYYVDLNGPHGDGDQWLRSARSQLDELGFDGDIEDTKETFPADARFDAPAVYFGWYAADLNGPMAREGFRFPPGAVALHIHSYSGHTLRSATSGWAGPLVARGVAATVANVFEPYLQLTHRPHLLLRALAQGKTFGEAAYYALPTLSWQAIAIGDPLYRPFRVALEQQLERAPQSSPALASYGFIRRARQFERRGRSDEAVALLQRRMTEAPGLPLQLALARAQVAAGEKARAVATLELARFLKDYRSDNWPIGRRIARELVALDAAEPALVIYRALAAMGAPNAGTKLALLREARAVADRTDNLARSIEFARLENEAAAVLPPPAAPAGKR